MKNFISKLTKKAGKKLLTFFKRDKGLIKLRATSKQAATKYDKIIDRFLIKEIRKKYPKHNILTEESGFLKGDSDYLWIIDSLDGTGNFANHNPLFSICIALLYKKEFKLGIVYAPALDEFYFAEKNKGAFLNGRRIKVSNVSNLSESYLVYCEGNEKDKNRFSKLLSSLYPKITDIRKIGSAGIEMAWVAAGKIDAYFTTKIEPWDVAAGILLVEEAGGKVTDFKGNSWKIKTSDLLISNNKIHSEIKKLIKNIF
jgi:myo-inositol-1(or 4)-monophosphatase